MTDDDLRALIVRVDKTIRISLTMAERSRRIAKEGRDKGRASRGYRSQQGEAELDKSDRSAH